MTNLFEPLPLGRIVLSNRIVMAPMTRSRADDAGNVGPLTAQYYAQRASAGLIVTEGLFPFAMGKGYIRTPGIASLAHAAAWRAVTSAVHAQGGRIFAQIMHCGRISDPSFLPGGETPVAPSAIAPKGASYTDEGMKPFVTPRALETHEVGEIIAEYGRATRRALAAGFDGVELHAASGYLPEQFLSSSTNERSDRYGGSIGGRARFVLEALEEMIWEAGADRVGIKIAPELGFNDIRDASPIETYSHLVRSIAPLGLAYLHVADVDGGGAHHRLLRPLFRGGAYLAGFGLSPRRAEELVSAGDADGVVFGAPFIANPDLPERIRRGAPLAEPDRATFYTPGPKGYVDYPTLEAVEAGGTAEVRAEALAS